MDLIPTSVKRLWNVWDPRLLVLLSLTLQIILSVFGNRRKYVSLLWLNMLVWLSYLMADQVAIIALSKLSDSQVGYDKGNTLWAIWAPLLLLHLGGPDSITAYSLEDNQLWMRHLYWLVVQFSVAVNVILISWKHSWFSVMSIPALVAGLIKYGERVWALVLVSHGSFDDEFHYLKKGSDFGSNDALEHQSRSIRALRLADKCFTEFRSYIEYYDLWHHKFSLSETPEVDDDIELFWKAIEVEMGLMFDVLYTKVPIRVRKGGWILRCITSTCTLTVLIGLIFRLISSSEDREKWLKVDIAITEVLLVGALTLEIYGIISLYLSSDWAMLWLINHKRGKQVAQFREKNSGIFRPKQYRCNKMAQLNLLEFFLKEFQPNQELDEVIRRLRLGKKKMFKKYALEPAVLNPSPPLFEPLWECCGCLSSGDQSFGEEKKKWTVFSSKPLEEQIFLLHLQTELWIKDDATENNRDSAVPQHAMAPSGSSSLWKEDMELCRTLSRYMMYLLVMRPMLLPIASSDKFLWNWINHDFRLETRGVQDLRAYFNRYLKAQKVFEHLPHEQRDVKWKTLKGKWVRMLCTAAGKGHRNEHLRQLNQGCEFITFLWFFLPQSQILSIVNPDNRRHAQGEDDKQAREKMREL